MTRPEGYQYTGAYVTPNHGTSDPHTTTKFQQILSTVALLALGYYVLSFFDAWPSTTKRTLYELVIYLVPSQLVYLLQYIMIHTGRLPDHSNEPRFRREDFGVFKAKEEAILRMLGNNNSITGVLQKARSLSGYDKLVYPKKNLDGPPGLGNWDNSCYQNSILQGLASLPAFRHYVHRGALLGERCGTSTDTTAALASFLEQLADTSTEGQTLWTPKVLKSMNSWQQQDAQEYLSRLLEATEKESLRYAAILSRNVTAGLNSLPSKEANSSLAKEESAKRLVHTLVGNPIDGLLAQALTCQTCNFSEGMSLTQFNCLTVNLGLGGSRSLEDLLDEYTQAELIEGVECDNCTLIANKAKAGDETEPSMNGAVEKKKKAVKKQLRTKAKQLTFGRASNDLVIHINRSIWDDYGNQIKNPSFVQFPRRLRFLNKWCAALETESEPDSAAAVYELRCIVTHSGKHDNGHYVAYGKREKEWYCFNDELVTKLSEEQVLSRGNVFMLFYEAADAVDLMDEVDDAEEIDFCEANSETKTIDIASPTSSSVETEADSQSVVTEDQ